MRVEQVVLMRDAVEMVSGGVDDVLIRNEFWGRQGWQKKCAQQAFVWVERQAGQAGLTEQWVD